MILCTIHSLVYKKGTIDRAFLHKPGYEYCVYLYCASCVCACTCMYVHVYMYVCMLYVCMYMVCMYMYVYAFISLLPLSILLSSLAHVYTCTLISNSSAEASNMAAISDCSQYSQYSQTSLELFSSQSGHGSSQNKFKGNVKKHNYLL